MALDKLFYINVGKSGTFSPSGNNEYDTTAADIDKLIAALEAKNQKKLLLYFHGGLVDAASGMEIASRIVSSAGTDGYSSYPICLVWETGFKEVLVQNFDTISKSEFFKKILVKIIKVAGNKLGIDIDDSLIGSKGIGSMGDEEILLELQKAAPFEKTFENQGKRSFSIKNASPENIESEAYYHNVVLPEVQAELEEEIAGDQKLINLAAAKKPDEEAKLMKNEIAPMGTNGEKGILTYAKLIGSAIKIAMNVIKRYMKKRDHGFYPTVIEEIFREFYVNDIGTWVWSRMKNKARDMWLEDDFSGNPENWHAGSYFLKKLTEYQDKVGALSIDIVGHSAGSIVTCELIDAVKRSGSSLRFRNIYFMAPACSCELFSRTLLQNQELFKNLLIFTMLDSYESKDRLVPVLYPRSLLYFISGVLEGEKEFDAFILGMQRHIIGNKPYNSDPMLNTISEYLKDKMIYSVTDANAPIGMRSGSISHGGFDDENETTLESIFYLIKK